MNHSFKLVFQRGRIPVCVTAYIESLEIVFTTRAFSLRENSFLYLRRYLPCIFNAQIFIPGSAISLSTFGSGIGSNRFIKSVANGLNAFGINAVFD